MISVETSRERLGVPRQTDFVDCCFMGWIPGVTSSVFRGHGLQFEKGTGDYQLKASEISEVCEMGREIAMKRPVHRVAGTHGPGAVIYESASGTPYRLDEITRAEICWHLRDPVATELLLRRGDRLSAPIAEKLDVAIAAEEEAFARATAFLEGLEVLFRETMFADLCMNRRPWARPWILLEGGLHLWSRCVAEVGRKFRFPIGALENCWIPDHFILTPETGAAVNRFALLYDRARGRELDVTRIRSTVEYLARFTVRKELPEWNREAYPWKFADEIPTTYEGSIVDHKYLILGQVPYDASITMDSDTMTVKRILWHLRNELGDAELRSGGISYRPHPMEEASRLQGHTSAHSFEVWCQEHRYPYQVIDGAELGLVAHLDQLSDYTVVVTANSQAGLEAAAVLDVFTYGRAFYDCAGVTRKRWSEAPVTGAARQARWAHFVRWMLEKLYVPKKAFGRDAIKERLKKWTNEGFSFFDPLEDF